MFALTRLLAALMLSAALAGSGGTNVVLTAAEANAFRKPGMRVVPNVTVRGLVISKDSPSSVFCLEDPTGNMYLSCDHGARPAYGERIEAVVRPRMKSEQWKPAHVLSWRPIGRGTVPPPAPVTARDVNDERFIFKRVTTDGVIDDAARDELDAHWEQILLRTGNGTVLLSREVRPGVTTAESLVGARVRAIGIVMRHQGGARLISGHCICVDQNGFTVLEPPPADTFDVEPLPENEIQDPEVICSMGRRRTEGVVEAVWNCGHGLVLSRGTLNPIRVDLAEPADFQIGTLVQAVGTPTTDRFNIRLKRSHVKAVGTGTPYQAPEDVSSQYLHRHFGRLVRLDGTVRGDSGGENARLELDCGERLVSLDASGLHNGWTRPAVGSRITVCGICIFEVDEWRPNTQFPRFGGYTILLRSAADVTVLAAPPWWTTERLYLLVSLLVLALLAILVWNRMLAYTARLKLAERTRLAVELHDTIAQNMTGLALHIDAAQMAAEQDPQSALPYLTTLVQKMSGCRDNLRVCLWDLRNRALDAKTLDDAIRLTIAPYVKTVRVETGCDIACAALSEKTLHAVLCIVRELVLNAIRHGHARRLTIRGALAQGRLSLTVRDDGCGFDPANRPGVADGHFGLQGIDERVRRLGGSVRTETSPGHGCTVKIADLNAKG